MHSVAPVLGFSMNHQVKQQTGQSLIQFPDTVTTVIIDIGARESDYLDALEKAEDPSVALIMFDPLPPSFVPLRQRADAYAMRHPKATYKTLKGQLAPKWLNPSFTNRVYAIQAAMGETEGTVRLKVILL